MTNIFRDHYNTGCFRSIIMTLCKIPRNFKNNRAAFWELLLLRNKKRN